MICACMTVPFKKYLLWNNMSEINFLKELFWVRATSKITEERIKPDTIELEKDFDAVTQNDEEDGEEYDPVSCELTK